MDGPRIGSLCSGYGGLDMAVQQVYGGRTVFVSDIDKGANKILAHRYPDVPNLGDFTKTDWADVEPVDILTAGFPCQPVSHAGKRLGSDDERWLWDDVARAVGELRPRLVVLENVRGLLTAGSGRLFGRVLGTLAALGYDALWHGLRAAEVGAPHGRWRVFIVAYRAMSLEFALGVTGIPSDADCEGRGRVGRLHTLGCDADRRGRADGPRPSLEPTALLPTPVADNSRGLPQPGTAFQSLPNAICALLPTPAVNDMGEGKTVERWDEWTADMQAKHGNGNGHGKSLAIEALRHTGSTTDVAWGVYESSVRQWERATRPAPEPTTNDGKDGSPRLSPRFVEWMMGLPAGWVTDVPGITRNEALKALGNGVVPQQSAEALRVMATWEAAA